jgi:hypothetical protein
MSPKATSRDSGARSRGRYVIIDNTIVALCLNVAAKPLTASSHADISILSIRSWVCPLPVANPVPVCSLNPKEAVKKSTAFAVVARRELPLRLTSAPRKATLLQSVKRAPPSPHRFAGGRVNFAPFVCLIGAASPHIHPQHAPARDPSITAKFIEISSGREKLLLATMTAPSLRVALYLAGLRRGFSGTTGQPLAKDRRTG